MNLFCSRGNGHVRLVATIAALVMVHTAKAQTGVVWATDAFIGLSHGGGGDFVNRSNPVAEIAASVGKPLRRGIGLDAEVSYDWSGNIAAHADLCRVNSPGGACTPDFPSISGPVGLVGVALGAADVVQLRVNAGVAAYSVSNTRLGAPMTAIDVAMAPTSWLAVVAGWRAGVLPNYRGDRLTVMTWHLGLRLQTHG